MERDVRLKLIFEASLQIIIMLIVNVDLILIKHFACVSWMKMFQNYLSTYCINWAEKFILMKEISCISFLVPNI